MATYRTNKSPQSSIDTVRLSLRDRWWWAPAAALFKAAVRLRHRAFDVGLKRAKPGALPAVVLGNITVGGTGKTPHVMSLMQALSAAQPKRQWAILSRGYGRNTKGYLTVDREGSPEEFGDEPLELARRFPKATIAVCEDRLAGIAAIQAAGKADAVLLDDGFQHRRLKPAFSIVLVDMTQPVDRDYFLPRGRLRDLPERLTAADAIIITRCPDVLTKGDLRLWRHRLHMRPEQMLLHTGTMVEGIRNLHTKRFSAWPRKCIAVSGIAHPAQFETSLARNCNVARHFAYPDHHPFTPAEALQWQQALEAEVGAEAIITTEKDAARMRAMELPENMPVLVLGMQVKWWDEDALRGLLTSIDERVDASAPDPDI
jgi:tetraacyldisaccharide 4'-kinase